MHRILTAVLLTVLALPALSITFNDGQLHIIDANNSFPLEAVSVFDGPGGASTTLSIVDGGQIGTITCDDLDAWESSIVNISGGEVGCFGGFGGNSNSLRIHDASEAHISGGKANNLEVLDTGLLVVTGGTLWRIVPASSAAIVNFLGGDTETLQVNEGIGHIEGGIVGKAIANSGILEINGGDIGPDGGGGACTGNLPWAVCAQFEPSLGPPGVINVTGGALTGTMQATEGGILNISGGSLSDVTIRSQLGGEVTISGGAFTGSTVLAFDTSTATLVGTEFSLPFGPIVPTTGTLTGIFLDGTPLSISFARASTATIVLMPAVPSLSPLGLCGLVVLLIGVLASQGHKLASDA